MTADEPPLCADADEARTLRPTISTPTFESSRLCTVVDPHMALSFVIVSYHRGRRGRGGSILPSRGEGTGFFLLSSASSAVKVT